MGSVLSMIVNTFSSSLALETAILASHAQYDDSDVLDKLKSKTVAPRRRRLGWVFIGFPCAGSLGYYFQGCRDKIPEKSQLSVEASASRK